MVNHVPNTIGEDIRRVGAVFWILQLDDEVRSWAVDRGLGFPQIGMLLAATRKAHDVLVCTRGYM